jgi:beta-phosphoglucomutase
MKWMEQFQLFLFDFDGVLVDTEPLHYQAYRQAFINRDIPWPYDFEQYCVVALGASQGVKKALYAQLPTLDWDAIAEEKKQIYLELLATEPLMLMPGVELLLHALQSQKRVSCVVTNSYRNQIEAIKEALPPLKSIPHWITREDYPLPKPAPDGYLTAIERFAPAADCSVIGFEDSLKGFEALSQTRARAVLVCPAHRAHVSTCLALGGEHFASFEAISVLK